jgi:uroporphyrinogen decarboxylase
MNSKQRVFAALTRKELPDRVPLQFDLCRSLTDAFSKKYGIPAHYTPSYYEDVTYRISANELRIAMGSDCVIVGGSLPRGYTPHIDKDGNLTNEFGMVMRQGFLYMEVIKHPMAHVNEVQEVLDFPFPDPLADGRYDDAEALIKKYKDEYFIIGDMELTMYDMMQQLVGTQKLLEDMAEGKPYVEALMDKTKDFA